MNPSAVLYRRSGFKPSFAGVLVALCAAGPASAGDCPLEFTARDLTTGPFPASVALGDLDADGDLDTVVAINGAGSVSVLLNTGSGNFAPGVSYPVGGQPIAVALGDVDGDGDLDMAVANLQSDTISVLLNTGNGAFAPSVSYAGGDGPFSLVIADLDGDGDRDIAFTQYEASRAGVLLNSGEGTFAAPVDYAVEFRPASVALGDLDSDGDLDMVVANQFGDNVSVLLNTGNATFAPRVNYATGSSPFSVALGDLDADGDLDMAVAQFDGNASVLLNTGNGTFAPSVNYPAGAFPISIALGDVDADGDLDLALANYVTEKGTANPCMLLLNTGAGTFADPVAYTMGNGAFSVALGDLNGDADLDIAVANSEGSNVRVLFNGHRQPIITTQPTNQRVCPGAPALFRVAAAGSGQVAFQWRRDAKPIPGAIGPTYAIPSATTSSMGFYDVLVTDCGGTVISSQAGLIVGGDNCCLSDWNADGVSNSTDVSDFINSWFSDQLTGCGG